MNQQHQNDHQQTQMLLPWYLNHTLPDEQRLLVERHLQQCPVCRYDGDQLQSLIEQLSAPPLNAMNAKRGWAALSHRLNDSTRTPLKPARWHSTTFKRGVAASLAASLLLLMLDDKPPQAPAPFHTLASPTLQREIPNSVRVVFSDKLSESDIEALLQPIHARITAPPNAVGAWRVTLDQDGANLDEAVSWLRQQPTVRFAEPIVQP